MSLGRRQLRRAGFMASAIALVIALAAAALSAIPFTQGSARADATSCAAATATAAADQQQLNDLLTQLGQARQTLADDQAALDEVTKDVTDDNNVIDQHNQLVDAGKDDSAKFQAALDEASNGVLGLLTSVLLDKGFTGRVLDEAYAQTEEALNESLELVQDLGEDALGNAELMAGIEQQQLALILREMAEPVFTFYFLFEVFNVTRELSSAVTYLIAFGLDVHGLTSIDHDYQRAKAEIDALTDRQDTLQEDVTSDKLDVNALESDVNNASDTVQQALQAEAEACASSPTPTDTPTSTPTDTPTGTPPPPSNSGTTYGDPHLVTFDGATYNFQQVGEFVLTKSTVDDFEIQVRQQPWDTTSCTVAENSAFAFHIGGQTVSVYAQNPGLRTLVNGNAVTLSTTAPYNLAGGGTITNNAAAAQESLVWPNGSSATVSYGGGFYLTLSIAVSTAEKGHLVGLLGTDAGNQATDLTTSTGTVLPYPAIASDTTTLYGTFANGWRVTSSDSLFTYAAGQNTATFTNTSFPCQNVNLGTLTQTQIASATATCQAAGASQEPFLNGCILDVAVTGDDAVAGSDAKAESAALGGGTTATQSITLASGNGAVGSLDPDVTVEDSCSGTTTQATTVAPDPGDWATPISGTQWDSISSAYTGCNETFITTFTLPAGATSPQITVTDMADNSANVSVNGGQPFITGNASGQCETDYTGSPMTGSTTSGLVTGKNTLTFDVDNCYPADGENPTGIDFSATVTYSTTGA